MLILMNFKGRHMGSDLKSKLLAYAFKGDCSSSCHGLRIQRKGQKKKASNGHEMPGVCSDFKGFKGKKNEKG